MSSYQEKFTAFAVLIQSFLVILQNLMIFVFNYEPEITTNYRIILTAIPLTIAIILAFLKKWMVFILVYAFTVLILLLNVIVFPKNAPYIAYNSLRFLLPVVIPSALCSMCLSSIRVIEKVLYKISWLTFFLVIIYIVAYFSGIVSIDSYNMSFSYGLLLPMLSLYSKKKITSTIASILLFLTVLAIGSRGAAIIFISYMIYDIVQSNKKRLLVPLILVFIVFILSLNNFAIFFENIGITSRTLSLLLDNEILYSVGREEIYKTMIEVLGKHPIKGIGLFGDRYYLEGSYCHNVFLEILLNWGVIIGLIIIVYFMFELIETYKHANKENRKILIKYLLATLAPLLVSGSYLTDYNMGLFIGMLFIIKKENNLAIKHF